LIQIKRDFSRRFFATSRAAVDINRRHEDLSNSADAKIAVRSTERRRLSSLVPIDT